MQITVEIPDEFLARLDANGLTAQSVVNQWVATSATRFFLPSEEERKRGSLDDFFQGMARLSHKIPAFTDRTFNREELYEDHD